MAVEELSFLLTFLLFTGCEAWDFCRHNYYSGYIYSYTSYIYCEYGCCGSYYEQYCCANTVGIICGAVFGGLVLLGIVIGVVICCVQSKGHRGTVVHPGHTTGPPNVTSVAFVTQPYYPAYGAQPIGPPPYTVAPPPAYGQHPAYPPTSSAPSGPNPAYPPTSLAPSGSNQLPNAPTYSELASGPSSGQVSDFSPPHSNKR